MDSNASSPALHSRHVISLALVFVLAAASYFAWQALFAAVLEPGASVVLLPTIFFCLTVVLFAVESVLAREWVYALLSAGGVFLPDLFFAHTPWHIFFVAIGITFGFLSIRQVQHALSERIHFSCRKSVASSLNLFLLGLSLVFCSQYFVHVQSLSWEELVPSFNLGEGTEASLLRLAVPLYPPLQSLQNDQVTVDSFLQTVRGGSYHTAAPTALNNAQSVTAIGTNFDSSVEATLLANEREQLTHLLGRPVEGEEKMNAVLSEVLRKKALAFLDGAHASTGLPVPVIPFILALLLFFTVYPVAHIFLPLWGASVGIIFRFLRRLGWIRIESLSVTQERLI